MKIIAVIIFLAMAVALATVLLSGCVGGGDGAQQEEGVAEPDKLIVTTDGYIIKLQPDGMTAVKTDDGGLELAKTKKAPVAQTPIDLIGYGDYIISIVSYGSYHTLVSVYDAVDLNDGTNRIEPIRETIFAGEYYTCRIYEETLYFVAKSSTKYLAYNEETKRTEETGNEDAIIDTYEGRKVFENVSTDDSAGLYGGYLLAKLPLAEPETSSYTLAAYRSRTISTLYFSPHAIFLVYNDEKSDGCDYSPYFTVGRVELDDLKPSARSQEAVGNIFQRYWLSDSGDYLMAAATDGDMSLYTFDREMNEVFSVKRILSDYDYASSCYFSGGYCYIEMSGSATKIDVSNPVAPVVLGATETEAAGKFILAFGEGFSLGVGVSGGILTVNYYQSDGDELYHINSAAFTLPANASSALDRRGILPLPDSNAVAVCVSGKVYVFGHDEYGYLEYKTTLAELDQSIYRTVSIGDYLYAVSDGMVISFDMNFEKRNEVATVL